MEQNVCANASLPPQLTPCSRPTNFGEPHVHASGACSRKPRQVLPAAEAHESKSLGNDPFGIVIDLVGQSGVFQFSGDANDPA